MIQDITDLVLRSITVNYKTCLEISEEIEINRNRVQKCLNSLKKRQQITWISKAASDSIGRKGTKYFSFERN